MMESLLELELLSLFSKLLLQKSAFNFNSPYSRKKKLEAILENNNNLKDTE